MLVPYGGPVTEASILGRKFRNRRRSIRGRRGRGSTLIDQSPVRPLGVWRTWWTEKGVAGRHPVDAALD